LLLHHLAELLKLGVGAEPLEIAQALPTGSSCSGGSGDAGARSRSATAACTRAAALLGGKVEQVHISIIIAASGSTGGRGRGGGSGGSGSGRGSLASATRGLLEMLGDSLETC
jgi:hypothetical protein